MCVNSCCAFTEQFAYNATCSWCDETAYNIDQSLLNVKTPRKVTTFLPLLDRFKLQFNNSNRSLDLKYRHQYINNSEYKKGFIGDIFDENLYKELTEDGYFTDKCNIALIGLT